MFPIKSSALAFCFAVCAAAAAAAVTAGDPAIFNPFPREVIEERTIAEWLFDQGKAPGWKLGKQVSAVAPPNDSADGIWSLQSSGEDPILESPVFDPATPSVSVSIRMRSRLDGRGQIFWTSRESPAPSENRASAFAITADGNWHEYRIACPFEFPVNRIRLDPATEAGKIEIDWIRVEKRRMHPLEIVSAQARGSSVFVTLQNHGDTARTVESGGITHEIPATSRETLEIPSPEGAQFLESRTIRVTSTGLPGLVRTLRILNADAPVGKPVELTGEDLVLQIVSEESWARILDRKSRREIAFLAPLAMRNGEPIPLEPIPSDSGRSLGFRGPGVERLEVGIDGHEIVYQVRADSGAGEMEGPILRVPGELEQGLLAGVEYLGKNEFSSTTLDIHGPEHVRHTPDPRLMTMPLMAVVTDRGSAAMRWEDPRLQPVFATPNFFDGGADHRLALRGRNIRARIRIGASFAEGERLETAIRWAVEKAGGLPPLPKPPREHTEQLAFCRESLMTSVIRADSGGWYHALVPGNRFSPEKPKYFADHLSTLFRLTGEIPEFPELVPGGAHIENSAIYFVTGQAGQWLDWQRNRARQTISSQRPDGSWRYGGEFRAGHFEDTSSGQCARNAALLLRFARQTGDKEALAAGLKALEFLKRFRTPRGAQVWECPLHAPDIMASAYAIQAYSFGYELTGDETYRDLAVRWALSGVPFVYQWNDRPIMRFATIATLCATNYRAPVWIGRPVQWCGLVYADALLDLAPHDDTLDWKRLAEGILISGEQQQYADGPSRGLLADSLILETQQLLPYDINPCALVSLRLRLAGEPAGLHLAIRGNRRILSPFPVAIADGEFATIRGMKDLKYQVVVDGTRIIDVISTGEDRVPLAPGPQSRVISEIQPR